MTLSLGAATAGWWLAGVLGALLGLVVLAISRHAEQRRQRRVVAAACRAALPGACRALAAELSAGSAPSVALSAVAAAAPGPLRRVLSNAAAAGQLGLDPAAMLATEPPAGCDRLRLVGACWAVCTRSGGGLADALARLADGLSDEQDAAAEIAAQLVGPRMSAMVMALLPVLGLGLGTALGAQPLRFLTETSAGLLCLVMGAGLNALGLLWVSRIAGPAVR